MKVKLQLALSLSNQKLVLLIVLTFCTGVFLSNYFTFSNGLFLSHFDHSRLPIAYIVSGLTGVVLIKGYAIAKRRLTTKSLFGWTLAFIAICAFSIWALYHANFQRTAIIFVSFAFLSSFYTLVGLQLWGITFNLFDVRSSKSVFAKIGSGGMIASLSGFILAGQVATKYTDNPEKMLLVGCIALCIALVVQQVIMFKFFEAQKNATVTEKSPSIKSLFKNDMVVLLFFMMIISVFLQYLIDYNFLKGSRQLIDLNNEQAESSEIVDFKSIPIYFAHFFAGIKLVELVLRFASGYIFKNLGMGTVLLVLPALFIILYLLLVIMDFSSGPVDYESFKLLFLVVLISKVFDRSLRSALDDPSRKMLYQPMQSDTRHNAQIYIDGYAKQLAIVLGGVFLLLINFISLQYWQMGLVVVLLSAFWLVIARSARKAYTRLLKNFLKLKSLARDQMALRVDHNQQSDLWDSFDQDIGNTIIPRDKGILQKHIQSKTNPDEELESILMDAFTKVKDKRVKLRLIALAHRYQFSFFLEEVFLSSRFDKRFTLAILPYFSTLTFVYQKEKHEQLFEIILQKCLRNLVWLKGISSDLTEAGGMYRSLNAEIEKEIDQKFLILFEILAIKKNRYEVMTLRHHLMNETPSDSRLFAIELFDVIFQDESEEHLKETLLSIFENNENAIKRNFLVYKTNAHERLEELLYADLFKISIETKRLAFQLMCEKYGGMYMGQISGCVYHSDAQIRRLAQEYGED